MVSKASLGRNWLKSLLNLPALVSYCEWSGVFTLRDVQAVCTHTLKMHAHIYTCERAYVLSKQDGAHHQTDVKLEAPTGRDKTIYRSPVKNPAPTPTPTTPNLPPLPACFSPITLSTF